MGLLTNTALLVSIAMLVAMANASFSSERLARADAQYPSVVQRCDAIADNFTKESLDGMFKLAERGLDYGVAFFPVSLIWCGRDRDQLSEITKRLCSPENDMVVICDGS